MAEQNGAPAPEENELFEGVQEAAGQSQSEGFRMQVLVAGHLLAMETNILLAEDLESRGGTPFVSSRRLIDRYRRQLRYYDDRFGLDPDPE